MNKPPLFLKVLGLLGVLSAFIGIYISFKFPSNIGVIPLIIALVLGAVVSIITKKRNIKCYAGYITLVLFAIGIIIMLVNQSKDSVIAVDEDQKELLDESNEEALDELENMIE